MRLALLKKRDEADAIRATIADDEAAIAELQTQLAAAPAGSQADVEAQLTAARDRLASNQANLEAAETSIREVTAMMRG